MRATPLFIPLIIPLNLLLFSVIKRTVFYCLSYLSSTSFIILPDSNSQQPSSQKNTKAGKVLEYDMAKPGGGTRKKQVQQQTTDANHGPHWEAGTPKSGGQKDGIGRDRLSNPKSKSHYSE